MIRSGRASASIRTTSASRRRSYSRLRGTNGAGQPRATSAWTTKEPRKPAPPVTTTRLPLQKPAMPSRDGAAALALEIGLDHHLDQFRESHLRRPAELVPRLARVAQEEIHLGRALQQLVDDHVLVPVEVRVGKG